MTATAKCLDQIQANRRGTWRWLSMLVGFFALMHDAVADTNSAAGNQLLIHAQEVFATASKAYESSPTNNVVAWEFARAAFARGEFATNDTERAAIAVQGIS